MLSTLKELKDGKITPQCLGKDKRLKIAEGLTEFPEAIFDLAEHIEILDMSDNDLSALPENFGRLKYLKILFLSNNQFDHIPDVISDCPELEMIAFKGNQIANISENALPVKTRWLILSDNKITKLPDAMGRLDRLQKLALAGNALTALPDSMSSCTNLELIRLSANDFSAMPEWLFSLPKLAWLAFSGNPCTSIYDDQKTNLTSMSLSQLKLGEQLGQGASGIIYKGIDTSGICKQPVAVKLFKGAVTSDGYPADELKCCLTAGEHINIIKAVAQISDEAQLGLVMELIPPSFSNLGLPPTLITCTRDTFTEGTVFEIETITQIAQQMLSALESMHGNDISHGDIYAHNIMIDYSNRVLFGDFGAATCYSGLPEHLKQGLKKIEMRALAYLIDDLLNQACQHSKKSYSADYNKLLEMKNNLLK